MDLNQLSPIPGSKRPRKRVGRGPGSGTGKTSGRGQKGQMARGGVAVDPRFEGGQMPMHMRLPKRGFTNIFAKTLTEVAVRALNVFEDGAVVDVAAMVDAGVVKKVGDGIKLLGNGPVERKLTVRVHKATKGAIALIEAAGGTVELI